MWWSNNVNWDGQSHWSKYLILSPKYMGPNALSVPFINNGSIDSLSSIGFSANTHFSKGDNTQNLVLYGNYTTKQNTISVDVQFVPFETFQLSHEKKTERKTFYLDYYKKKTVGDVVASTTIQLFQKKRDKIQLALRLGIRMPSGGLLTMARYADVPSYWIDIGGGLPFKNSNWKWIGMAGFLVWQTNIEKHRQNDAILFGSGFEWNKKGLRLQAYGAGYSGYLNNGDRPTLVRVNIEKRKNNKVYIFRLQQGLHDFAYFSAEAGARFILEK
ncbi:MAG: hypothetical protein SGI96_08460 [Bacteroidota bacterium]|nr:hypothetical protein [Bacteroidota bacterium]